MASLNFGNFGNFADSARDQSGQATVEYILLLGIVMLAFLQLLNGVNKAGIASKLLTPISGDFASAYQFGHVQATGYGGGGTPKNHPRAEPLGGGENNNFRIFRVAK